MRTRGHRKTRRRRQQRARARRRTGGAGPCIKYPSAAPLCFSAGAADAADAARIYMTKAQTAKAPSITQGDKALVMYDPDAPGGGYLHWVRLADGSELVPYKGPSPPPGHVSPRTGRPEHEYIFALTDHAPSASAGAPRTLFDAQQVAEAAKVSFFVKT